MKAELRDRLRVQLAALDAGTVRANSAAVWERLAGLPEFQAAKCLCVYVSTGKEIETHGLIRQLLAIGRQVCVPAWREGYAPVVVESFDRLLPGKFGILEPPADWVVGVPDLWIVPGIAFDAAGNRLGRGKGFFDGLLREATGVTVGLAHDFQIVEKLPVEAHDVRLDFVVTPSQTFSA